MSNLFGYSHQSQLVCNGLKQIQMETHRQCRTCGEIKPQSQYQTYAGICDTCVAAQPGKLRKYYRVRRRLLRLREEIRMKDAYIQEGYTFKGTIPEPKTASYYKINQ